jgi:predicted unusual protein kinase regulating ubiquinone biosynthesis (AarF/ABC1/UbiB family)
MKLASINILYVKIFQAIALNNHFIDDETNNRLLKFTDNAPWNEDDIDYNTLKYLENNFNINFNNNFDFDNYFIEPINSGMISLVFKAKNIKTNETLAVKIKRRNIDFILEDAIDDLLFFIGIINWLPFFGKYKIANVIQNNIDIIKHQTNFSKEVDNILLFKENCKNLKYVKIPNVYAEITKKYDNVIVMEFIQGMTIEKVDTHDYELFAKQVLKFGFVTSLVHGVTHGDLHCGNILFIKDICDVKYPHKICILDFGIIYNMNNHFKVMLFDIIHDMFVLPSRTLAGKLLLSGILEPIEVISSMPYSHYNNILDFLTEIIDDTIHKSKEANQIQIYHFISKFTKYIESNNLYSLGIKFSDNFVKIQLVLGMAHGVTMVLCKNDYITMANKVINELFHTELMDI